MHSASIYIKGDKKAPDGEANPLPTKPQDVLILLDTVENQMYGSKLLPVVTTVRWDINSDLDVNKQPVTFLPLSSQQISCIQVTFLDINFEKLNLSDYTATIQLHFKPKIEKWK